MPTCPSCKVAFLDSEVHECKPKQQFGVMVGVGVAVLVILPFVTGVWWLAPVVLIIRLVGFLWLSFAQLMVNLVRLIVG